MNNLFGFIYYDQIQAKPKPVIVEPKRLPGPIFKGDSYNRAEFLQLPLTY